MLTLAIELSTDIGSFALLDDERVVFERTWQETHRQRQQFFAALQVAVEARQIELPGVDLFAVGLGPGAFAGLRAAVAAAQALALPGGKAVYGVSSAEALAMQVFEESGAATVFVIGDARRERLWVAHFERGHAWPQLKTPCMLKDYASLNSSLTRGRAVWVSPDWDRIGDRLRPLAGPDGEPIEERRIPVARWVGMLARRKVAAGIAAGPVAPIYMHPPVAAEPGS